MKSKSNLDKKINSIEQLLIKYKAQREEERLNYLVEKKVEEILKIKIEEFKGLGHGDLFFNGGFAFSLNCLFSS
mgnify:CR=1 FL=1